MYFKTEGKSKMQVSYVSHVYSLICIFVVNHIYNIRFYLFLFLLLLAMIYSCATLYLSVRPVKVYLSAFASCFACLPASFSLTLHLL